jgi:hypothetical protein
MPDAFISITLDPHSKERCTTSSVSVPPESPPMLILGVVLSTFKSQPHFTETNRPEIVKL